MRQGVVVRGEAGFHTMRPQRTGGGTPEGLGEGQSPRASVFFDSATYANRGEGGDRRGSVGGEPLDFVKYRRAAAASALAPTVAALSLLFRAVPSPPLR